ncbi:MAG: MFS transporter [Gammaproteobacteria bacterium]|nr:MAG: MFS transporter [Gammaproteobacteria bacterium]RLA53938.1 MAG: MFS transporter [Gammaproteobacteria bacterium]
MSGGTTTVVPYWRLSGFYFFYFALLGGMFPYWPLYLQNAGFDAEHIGALLAIPMLTKVVAPNIWSWLADTTGRRLGIIQLGSLLGFICFTGVFIDDGFWWLAIVMVSYSFFWNAVLPQHEVITLNYLADKPERYSRLRLWGSVGFIIAVTGAGKLYENAGIDTFPWLALGLLATIFLSSLTIPKPLEEGTRVQRDSLWRAAMQGSVLAFLCAGILLQIAHGAYYSFFSIYMEELGYTRTAIGMLWSIGVVAEVVVFIVMHNLLLSFGIRTVLIASLVLAALRWFIIGYGSHWFGLLIFAQCLHAFTFGTFHAAAIDTIRRLFKPSTQGGGQALYGAVSFGIGGALGSFLAGRYWSEGAEFVFGTASFLCAIAAVIAWFGFRDPRLH